MAINLSNLSNNVTKAVSLSNLILVTPQEVVGFQPQNPPNADGTDSTAQRPPAFLFDFEGEQKVIIESDITDHYSEDNTPLQNQWAHKPERFQTKGFIAELNDVPPPGLALLKSTANRLTNIVAYAPQISVTATVAYNNAFALYQAAKNVANTAVSAWSSINNVLSNSSGQSVINAQGLTVGSQQNKQQVAFQQLYGYWKSRTLFTVQTPWAVFENMAIDGIIAVQEDDTETTSNFGLSFKMMRFAKTLTTFFGSRALDGRAASQAAGLTDLGVSSPTPSISVSQGLSSVIG